MAIVTWLAIFPLITALTYGAQPFVADLPIVARTFAFTLVLVPLMTYLVMPRATRLFERWLYPRVTNSSTRKIAETDGLKQH